MRRFTLLIFFLIFPALIFADGIQLTEQVSIDLNMRYRLEIDDRFEYETIPKISHHGANEYNLLRTQLGLNFLINDKISARVKFQDSRFLGTTGSNKESSSAMEMHQAYVQVNEIFNTPLSFQLGRYEMMYGRRRVLGNGNWNNYGPRAYDGFRLKLESEEYKIHLFGAKIWDRGHQSELTGYDQYVYEEIYKFDRNLFGIAATFLEDIIHPLVYVDYDRLQNVDNIVYTAGFYGKIEIEDILFQCDYYSQTGENFNRDKKAFLAAADVTYTFDNWLKPNIGVGFDITSGGKPESFWTDKDDKVFTTPFMSKHAFRGYMDLFSNDQGYGLNDYMVKIGIKPDKFRLDVHLHSFSYREKWLSYSNRYITEVGKEIDIRLRAPLYDNLDIDTAYCFFLADKNWPGWDYSNSSFFYLSVITRF